MANTTEENHKYRVQYNVTREETYKIEAANEEEATDNAFTEGEVVETGGTLDVTDLTVELVAAQARRQAKRPRFWNGKRAGWARTAINAFIAETGADEGDALCDLLCDLMHLADFEGCDFDNERRRALIHYEHADFQAAGSPSL